MFAQLRSIPLLPLLGAAYLIFFGRRHSRKVVHAVAIFAVAASCLITLDAFFFGLMPASRTGGGVIVDAVSPGLRRRVAIWWWISVCAWTLCRGFSVWSSP